MHYRQLKPTDTHLIIEMHKRHSSETIVNRFLGNLNPLPTEMASRFAKVDHIKREAIGAFVKDKQLIGVVRFDVISPSEAELAIVVEDKYQRTGVGRQLMRELKEKAVKLGIHTFITERFRTNFRIYRLLRSLDFTVIKSDYDNQTILEYWRFSSTQIPTP